jgi:hypothetical protein
MGNAISVTTQTYFFTSCMAKYTCITKPQVMALRNILVALSISGNEKRKNLGFVRNADGKKEDSKNAKDSELPKIRRRHLHQAMQKINIVAEPDQEVLDLLFTMWTNPEDEITKTRAPWYEFMISVSLLACKTDTLDQALRFALHVISRRHSANTCRTISAGDAIAFLKGKPFIRYYP